MSLPLHPALPALGWSGGQAAEALFLASAAWMLSDLSRSPLRRHPPGTGPASLLGAALTTPRATLLRPLRAILPGGQPRRAAAASAHVSVSGHQDGDPGGPVVAASGQPSLRAGLQLGLRFGGAPWRSGTVQHGLMGRRLPVSPLEPGWGVVVRCVPFGRLAGLVHLEPPPGLRPSRGGATSLAGCERARALGSLDGTLMKEPPSQPIGLFWTDSLQVGALALASLCWRQALSRDGSTLP